MYLNAHFQWWQEDPERGPVNTWQVQSFDKHNDGIHNPRLASFLAVAIARSLPSLTSTLLDVRPEEESALDVEEESGRMWGIVHANDGGDANEEHDENVMVLPGGAHGASCVVGSPSGSAEAPSTGVTAPPPASHPNACLMCRLQEWVTNRYDASLLAHHGLHVLQRRGSSASSSPSSSLEMGSLNGMSLLFAGDEVMWTTLCALSPAWKAATLTALCQSADTIASRLEVLQSLTVHLDDGKQITFVRVSSVRDLDSFIRTTLTRVLDPSLPRASAAAAYDAVLLGLVGEADVGGLVGCRRGAADLTHTVGDALNLALAPWRTDAKPSLSSLRRAPAVLVLGPSAHAPGATAKQVACFDTMLREELFLVARGLPRGVSSAPPLRARSCGVSLEEHHAVHANVLRTPMLHYVATHLDESPMVTELYGVAPNAAVASGRLARALRDALAHTLRALVDDARAVAQSPHAARLA